MIRATFTFPDKTTSSINFPNRPHGLKRNNQRPIKCEIMGEYISEDIKILKTWLYSSLRNTLNPKIRYLR